ncbi:MAG: VCBS repeat-containing protein [Verrucomicrobia bacterium]|nr:VCBS repeat-containing protein [Verrucomicrobiota bacterium]MBU1736105.1 VCBS repeat-containing protein [Verrucomicrobiota bacterium]MBU1856157.1 VCBS repeat-containing protein [Verrucomicrobiota bacterium]
MNAIPTFSRYLSLCLFLLASPALAGVWRFAVIGNTRGDGPNTTTNQWVNTPVLAAMATAISNDCPELVLVAGDLIYGDPASSNSTNMAVQYALWTNAMAPVYKAGIPVYPVRGNHDSYGDDALGAAFLTAFTNTPRNGPTGEVGLTYSFTHKNAFFAALDQYCTAHTVNQAWLTNQLALNTKTHLFTFGHEPAVQVMCSSCLAENRTARNAFINSLTDAGSLLYFCGHDHFYDHAIVTAPNGRTFRQLVVGSGGAPAMGWSGVYGADFGESDMAVNVRHIGYTNGYSLVTVSNFTVTVEWKGSTDLTTWQTLDTAQYILPNPAVHRINDYDGDSKSDLVLYDESIGNWTVLFSSQYFESGAQPIMGGIGRRAAPGDYDGDGKTDIAVMSKTGTWWMLLSGSAYLPVSTNFGVICTGTATNASPVPADYDGDGITDLAYYEKASGTWGILYSDSGQAVTAPWGGPGFIPAPADFDGDDKADPCLYQESTGKWYILLSSSGYLEVSAIWGGSGYQAVPADYDNDGRADPCVCNRTTGEWQVLLSGSSYANSAYFTWGNAAYRPLSGDYDGDGLADPMVYADSISDWSVMLSGDEYKGSSLPFGGTNWAAVKSLWREDLVFVAFGDSITYGDGSSTDSPATGYPKLLETKLKQNYDGYFSSINQGRDGEDTWQGVERFSRMLDATNPNLVLLMEGTNDHGDDVPFDEIEENLSMMIQLAQARGIRVIIATIPPVIANEYRDRSAQMERIVAFNPRIYQIAKNFNIPVAPVFEAITAVPGWESSLMNQPSANHPNDAGYRIVRDAFYTPISAGLYAGQY